MNQMKAWGVSASLLLTASASLANTNHFPKHLAGPAEEIELLQKSHPAEHAITSKHAMIAVNMAPNKQGSYGWEQSVKIDGDNPKALLFAPNRDKWQLSIRGMGQNKSQQSFEFFTRETEFGMGQEQFPATQFELQNLPSGEYKFGVQASHNEAGYLLVSSDSPYQLQSFANAAGYLVGEVIDLNASATTSDKQFTMVTNDLQMIQSSYLRITQPDGVTFEVSMFDDGMATDKAASDGQFNGQFVAEQAGLYQVQVISEGLTPNGKPFYRTVEHVIPVIESDLSLSTKVATGAYSAPHKIDLSFGVDTALDNGRFRVMAEVWGTDPSQKAATAKAVSWLSTIAEINHGELTLQLDDRWLLDQGVSGPYALKNIRLEDTQYYINMLAVDELPLLLPSIRQQSKSSYKGGITESMLQGDKPAVLNNRPKAAGGKLMLVHGYCSGDAWGPVQNQFSNYVKFTDFNQNRSHDQFARLIDSYGDNFPSFGVVAHSQGGAAALHLYTYYWSGLDNAGSGRLIQSVGTPYQGTPLAGNLALIGDIFGIGCGYNGNLTTSGASAWLSGIPTWARSKVNYYTTSFTDKWWRWDYCNIASDLVLSDPEDGTTERSRGQLSGANNRGHKTGQCHTEGMRDMAQTRDSGRNGSMSSNAAR